MKAKNMSLLGAAVFVSTTLFAQIGLGLTSSTQASLRSSISTSATTQVATRTAATAAAATKSGVRQASTTVSDVKSNASGKIDQVRPGLAANAQVQSSTHASPVEVSSATNISASAEASHGQERAVIVRNEKNIAAETGQTVSSSRSSARAAARQARKQARHASGNATIAAEAQSHSAATVRND